MFHYLHGSTSTADPDPLGSYLSSYGVGPAKKLAEGFKEIFKTISSMDTEMAKISKTMGITTAQAASLKNNFSLSYQEVADLGGQLSDVVGQQEALLNVTGRNLISLQEQSKELYAAVSVTGIKAEELEKSFYNAGMEGAHIAENVVKIVQVSNQLGVNAQAVSKVVVDNLDKMNRFGFTNGVEGLAKMAGRAAALRFDVNETFKVAEDLMSPEKAIEVAASIQRLGGAATALTDPLKLMDLAQNDVEGLQNEMQKLAKQYTYFDEKTKTFQIMPGARRQLNEVAGALGVDRKEFEKLALESAKLDEKMSKIKFSGLDISKEDREQLANLAQLKDFDGKKEYVINYRDEKGQMQQAELAHLSKAQLDAIKKQTEEDAMQAGEDPQERLIQLAKEQLGFMGRLVAANEKIANIPSITAGGSKAGNEMLKNAAEKTETFAKDIVETNFGAKSEFKKKLDEAGANIGQIGNLFTNLLTGDITTVFKSIESATSLFGSAFAGVGTDMIKVYKDALDKQLGNLTSLEANVTSGTINVTTLKGIQTLIDETKRAIGGGDGFKTPKVGGDTLKTPSGDIVLHDKDYFLAATQLPDVLQKSVNKGLIDVLKVERQSMNAAMQTSNISNQNPPPKQEVVHTVNFKVSVDGPRNKLTDMLVEELPKNPSLMQYIVKHFNNTKSSGGMVVKK